MSLIIKKDEIKSDLGYFYFSVWLFVLLLFNMYYNILRIFFNLTRVDRIDSYNVLPICCKLLWLAWSANNFKDVDKHFVL